MSRPSRSSAISTALIPFLEHDDANRALMGANMQRQAVPLLRPDAPIIGTGMECQAARDSGQVVVAKADGIVLKADWRAYHRARRRRRPSACIRLVKFMRSNQDTCINQRPSRVGRRDACAATRSSPTSRRPMSASSRSARTCWSRLCPGRAATTRTPSWSPSGWCTRISLPRCTSRSTRSRRARPSSGDEEITRDIPNVGQDSLRNLDETGVIYVGADVNPNDILVGKITPKGETDLTAEERLLRAIFGEKAREVKDTSLRVPHGVRGKVIDVKVFTREDVARPAGGREQDGARADRPEAQDQRRRQDGRPPRQQGRGQPRILPIQDMPFLPDGRPVDIILNPIGVPSRMNLGQILETHLGWAAARLGYRVATPVFDGAREDEILTAAARGGAAGGRQDHAVRRAQRASRSTIR